MAIRYSMSSQLNGTNGYGINFTDTSFNIVLNTSDTDRSFTVPEEFPSGTYVADRASWIAQITTTSQILVSLNAPTVPPSAPDVFERSKTFLVNQYATRFVQGGDEIHVQSPIAGTLVTVELYAVNR